MDCKSVDFSENRREIGGLKIGHVTELHLALGAPQTFQAARPFQGIAAAVSKSLPVEMPFPHTQRRAWQQVDLEN